MRPNAPKFYYFCMPHFVLNSAFKYKVNYAKYRLWEKVGTFLR